MCTELILALLYFLTIFIVNYFLLKVIQKNLENISYFQKIEKIFFIFEKKKKKSSFYYFIRFKKSLTKISLLSSFNRFLKSNDILLIGHSYRFLMKDVEINFQKQEKKEIFFLNQKNFLEEQNQKTRANSLYLSLLQNQYLNV